MEDLWYALLYILLAILAILVFRLILHILIIFLSKRKNRKLKLRVAEDYDFIEGWKPEPEESHNSREKD